MVTKTGSTPEFVTPIGSSQKYEVKNKDFAVPISNLDRINTGKNFITNGHRYVLYSYGSTSNKTPIPQPLLTLAYWAVNVFSSDSELIGEMKRLADTKCYTERVAIDMGEIEATDMSNKPIIPQGQTILQRGTQTQFQPNINLDEVKNKANEFKNQTSKIYDNIKESRTKNELKKNVKDGLDGFKNI